MTLFSPCVQRYGHVVTAVYSYCILLAVYTKTVVLFSKWHQYLFVYTMYIHIALYYSATFIKYTSQLKDETVSLVDVIAPPDHILQSPIGHSNGQVCQRPACYVYI